jgi:hypothetical protein
LYKSTGHNKPTESEKGHIKSRNLINIDIVEYEIAIVPLINWFNEKINERGTIFMKESDIAAEMGDKFTHKSMDNIYFALKFVLCSHGIRVFRKQNSELIGMEFYNEYKLRFKRSLGDNYGKEKTKNNL